MFSNVVETRKHFSQKEVKLYRTANEIGIPSASQKFFTHNLNMQQIASAFLLPFSDQQKLNSVSNKAFKKIFIDSHNFIQKPPGVIKLKLH
jgi:hypothetical protein